MTGKRKLLRFWKKRMEMPSRWRLWRLWKTGIETRSRRRLKLWNGASAGARKRKVGRLDSLKHLVQYNTKWESEFPWLVPKKDTCKVVGMLCSL